MKKMIAVFLSLCLILPGFTLCGRTGSAEGTDAWNLRVMGFDRLLEAAKQDGKLQKPMLVAVIDTGCDIDHELFRGRISPDSRSFFGAEDDISNPDGHGTTVAGVIASATPENVKLLILKVGEKDKFVSDGELKQAILYALDKGADVINFCISMSPITPGDQEKYTYGEGIRLCREKGVPFVCGAGNKALDAMYAYPASEPGAIAVSGVTPDGTLARNSNYGSDIDFSAPGAGIYVAEAGTKSGYHLAGGTSLAAPHISAAAVYLRMVCPEYSVSQMEIMLHAYSFRRDPPEGMNAAADMPLISELILGEEPAAGMPLYPYLRLVSAETAKEKEGPENLFDGDPTTKWCIPFGGTTEVEWAAEEPVAPAGILFVTGNDNSTYPGRNPEKMILYGRNNPDEEWREIWKQGSVQKLPDRDREYCAFEIPGQGEGYTSFRLAIGGNGGDEAIQLSMIALKAP